MESYLDTMPFAMFRINRKLKLHVNVKLPWMVLYVYKTITSIEFENLHKCKLGGIAGLLIKLSCFIIIMTLASPNRAVVSKLHLKT